MINFLNNDEIHPSWKEFFDKIEIKDELVKIGEKLSKMQFTPRADLVLRFSKTDLDNIKVIWLGKDVYPQKNVATGRSFEVNFEVYKVNSWESTKINASLRNILKALNKTIFNKNYSSSIAEVRKEIKQGKFNIPAPKEIFDYWENQGVLFINSAFTCDIGGIEVAGNHLVIWEKFFIMLLNYIVSSKSNIKYFLWGNSRTYHKQLVDMGIPESDIYLSTHPCTNGEDGWYKNDSYFLDCPCFNETQDLINWSYK